MLACGPNLSGVVIDLDQARFLKQGSIQSLVGEQVRTCERLCVRQIVEGRLVVAAKLYGPIGAKVAVRFGNAVMGDVLHLVSGIVEVDRVPAGVVPSTLTRKPLHL